MTTFLGHLVLALCVGAFFIMMAIAVGSAIAACVRSAKLGREAGE